MQALVPKSRKPRFDFILQIIDLNNIPLSSGTAHVKWRLPSSTTAEYHGSTEKAIISDHRAQWNYKKNLQVRLTIGKSHLLQNCELQLQVIQEFATGTPGEKNLLGRVKLNLAEYADKMDDEEGIIRRYLMYDSKINSTLKLGVMMHQLEGERSFSTPPLKSATVFDGITSVISTEQCETGSDRKIPLLCMENNEAADMQDIYRRTLAASWSSRDGDLPADKLIEELFSGCSTSPGVIYYGNIRCPMESNFDVTMNDTDSRQAASGGRLTPCPGEQRRNSPSNASFYGEDRGQDFISAADYSKGQKSTGEKLQDKADRKEWRSQSTSHEVSEFDIRENLRSWEVSRRV